MTPSIECLYCSQLIPPTTAKQYTCPSCWQSNTELFGPDWYIQDWHVQLLPSARSMKHNLHGVTGLPQGVREWLRIVSVDNISDCDVVVDTLPQAPRMGRKRLPDELRQAIAILVVTEKFSTRAIHRRLTEEYGERAVSFSSVRRLVRQIRKLPLPGASTVD